MHSWYRAMLPCERGTRRAVSCKKATIALQHTSSPHPKTPCASSSEIQTASSEHWAALCQNAHPYHWLNCPQASSAMLPLPNPSRHVGSLLAGTEQCARACAWLCPHEQPQNPFLLEQAQPPMTVFTSRGLSSAMN